MTGVSPNTTLYPELEVYCFHKICFSEIVTEISYLHNIVTKTILYILVF